MQRLQTTLFWTIVMSETTHIFCCVLPTVISLLSLLGGAGLLGTMPGLTAFHEMIHQREIPLIIFSGVMLLLGWGLHLLSKRLDCHSAGCAHEPCGPKKKNASLVLKIASLLFVGNTVFYVIFHIS